MAQAWDEMVKSAKQRSKLREAQVLEVIEWMKKEEIPINFASVSQYSHASKSFLYKNSTISALIRSSRDYILDKNKLCTGQK